MPRPTFSSHVPETARRGEETVALALEIAADLGAPAVSGITYAAFNSYSRAAERQTGSIRSRLRLHVSTVRAGELGVRLGVEPVNRYESYLVNTLDQAAALIGRAGGRNMFVHMDTFHMNIEEPDIPAAIGRNWRPAWLCAFADSHLRGALGDRQSVPDLGDLFPRGASGWRAIAGDHHPSRASPQRCSGGGPDLVGGVRLWREAWKDSEAVARTALDVMKAGWSTAVAATRPT